MPQDQSLQDLLRSQASDLPIWSFLIYLALSAFLAFLLGRLYARCGRSLSNREALARNFVLLSVTTMLVISVVKSSLALSLGLVGALSIVRFRAAIKEPEELVYLFLAIAIGLGFGANQWEVTIVAFLFVAVIILIKDRLGSTEERQNLYLTVFSDDPDQVDLGRVVGVLKAHCTAVSVTRFDETKDALEASFLVDLDGFEKLDAAKQALRQLGDSVRVSFLENKGVT